MPAYTVNRELRIGSRVYGRGDKLAARVAESLPERTRKALERLGWISEAIEEPRRDEPRRKAGGS